jgi:signal transduction histidine kinase
MAVYAISALFGCWLFRTAMVRLVDDELNALADELIPEIEIVKGHPSLENWARMMRKGPYRSLPIIQLYDETEKLVESHGPPGVPVLFSRLGAETQDIKEETYHIRVHAVPLPSGRKVIGYLQLELALKNVDNAISQFGYTMTLISPFILIGFGLAGYLFSSKAARPVEKSFEVLKRFMVDASHELGTPISIILANAESIEADPSSNQSAKDSVGVIVRSIDRMNKLVGDLTLLAQMENPLLSRKESWFDFSIIVGSTITDFNELFKAQSVELKTESIEPVHLYGDSDALKRVIANLLQNSLKYTNKGGTVTVLLENQLRQAKLTVYDTGIGIPPESLSRIFDRFYRVDQSRSRSAGGSGLGLSIVKAIVEAHKGRLEVQSEVGIGTTISVYLPLK